MSGESHSELTAIDERFALLADAESVAGMGSWAWHVADDRVFWSRHCYEILGLDPATVEPSVAGFFAAVHPEDRPGLQSASAHMRDTGATSIRTARIVRPDGEIRHLRMTSKLVEVRDGVPLRIVGTLLDVTQARQGEEEQERTTALLNEAQRIANVGSWVWELDSGSLEWSEQMYRICGKSTESFAPTFESFLALIHPDDRRAVADGAKRVLDGRIRAREVRVLREDGQIRQVVLEGRVSERDGRAIAVHGTALDVTDRKALESQLRQAQKMEALGKLAGGVAHDLNNYLQIISGNLDFLEEVLPLDDGDANLAQGDIRSAVELCSGLTRRLLAFSRQQGAKRSSLDVHRVIEESIALVGNLMGPTVHIETDLKARRSATLADAHQLEQVLVNLLVNCRDAMAEGGVIRICTENAPAKTLAEDGAPASVGSPLSVSVAKPEGGREDILLTVSDTGHGMSEETRSRVFDPFFTTKPEGHGTGLGLSMVYGIIQAHHGTVRCESEPGKGTSVIIRLPSSARSSAPRLDASSQQEERVPAKGSPVVLVVDDEPMVRRMVVNSLKREGYSVHEAEDGMSALKLLREHLMAQVDMIVSDVLMPNLTGTDFAMRAREIGCEAPVLLMTGFAGERHLRERELAQFPVLAKPFSRAELLSAVGTALEDELPN